ncbi:APC family permease [Rhodococcus qingshengii]|uniref:APC family permease n=1 Tax=Rhodococcus qingshengii TaxID=334542 RepID=UPI0036524A3F
MTHTSVNASHDASGDDRTLRGSLGTGSIVLMVVAAAAPLTVISGLVPLGISGGNGAGFPMTFAVTTGVLLLFAVGFTAMSRYIPGTGAFYLYVGHGLGRGAGVGSAMLALVSYSTVQLAVYGYLGPAMSSLITSYGGPEVPWWIFSLASLALVAVLGFRHIELSGKVLGILLIAEVGIVVVLDAFIIADGGPEGPSTAMFSPSEIFSGSPGVALVFALAGYIGFESTAIFRDEAKDPARTIPRATYAALILIGGFYALSSWAVVTAWGDKGAVDIAGTDPDGMLITTATDFAGTVTAHLIQILLVSSLFAAVLSLHNVLARYIFVLSNTGVLPGAGGRTHRVHGSPHIASVVQSCCALVLLGACIVIGLDPVTQIFAWFAGVATVGIVALMLLTCLAVLVFFHRTKVDQRFWHTKLAPSLGLVGLIGFAIAIAGNLPLLLGGNILAVVMTGVLVLAFVGGFLYARRRKQVSFELPS